MAEEIITSSEEIEQTTEEVVEEENIDELIKAQNKNKFIHENKDSFFEICNKMLDFLYNARDCDDNNKNQTLEEEDRNSVIALAQETELIRNKIHIDAPLADIEFARLALYCQFVGEDMYHMGQNYLHTAAALLDYVKELTK